MEITNGKVYYRTPSPFEAPATSVELVFTVGTDDDVAELGSAALHVARSIAQAGLTGKSAQPATEPAKKRATAAEKKALKAAKDAENKDPMADDEPAKTADTPAPKVPGPSDPMADDDAPKADTAGGVVPVDLDEDLEGGNAEVISDAKLQEAVRKQAARITGKVVKAEMKKLYGQEQMSGIPADKRASFIAYLEGLEA